MTLYNRVPEKSTTRCDVFSQVGCFVESSLLYLDCCQFVKLVGEVKRAQIIVNKVLSQHRPTH